MGRLVGFGALVLLAVLAGLGPLWVPLGRAALAPVLVSVLHALAMMGLAQWALARGVAPRAVAHPADYVTIARAMIGSGCLGVVVAAAAGDLTLPAWWLAAPAAVALLLDAVDGPVARRTRTASPAGGRFDLECDAVLVLILAMAAALVYGPWVLVLGMMRYLFVLAGAVAPRLRRSLAFSRLRRGIAGAQGVVLVVSVTPWLPHEVNVAMLVVALVLVAGSFGRDVVTLLRGPATAGG